jgi:hypothetical protein
VDLWTTHRVAHNPAGQPPQKRSIDALQKAVTLTRQRQSGLAGHLQSQTVLHRYWVPIITRRSDFADRKGLIENSHRWDLAQAGESQKLFFIMLLCC